MRVMALGNHQHSGTILPGPSGQFRHVMLAALEAPGFKAGVFDGERLEVAKSGYVIGSHLNIQHSFHNIEC